MWKYSAIQPATPPLKRVRMRSCTWRFLRAGFSCEKRHCNFCRLASRVREVVLDPAAGSRVCGTSFQEPKRRPARAGPRRGFRFDPSHTCGTPPGFPIRRSARAGRHFGNRGGPPRARDPVAVPVSTPRARARPRRGSRDGPPRVRDPAGVPVSGSRAGFGPL